MGFLTCEVNNGWGFVINFKPSEKRSKHTRTDNFKSFGLEPSMEVVAEASSNFDLRSRSGFIVTIGRPYSLLACN
jgi:hypothetical protein